MKLIHLSDLHLGKRVNEYSINRSQFLQIAMIAQGDFLKLLLAPTEDRKKIFRQIFKTQLYQDLQDRLKRESSQLNDKCDAARNSIKQYIDGISCDENDVLSIDVEKAKNGILPTKDVIDLVDRLLSQDNDKKSVIEKSISDADKKLEIVNANLGKIEATEKAKTALEKAQNDLAAENETNLTLKDAFEIEKGKAAEKDKLAEEKAKIEAEFSRYSDAISTIKNKADELWKEYKLAITKKCQANRGKVATEAENRTTVADSLKDKVESNEAIAELSKRIQEEEQKLLVFSDYEKRIDEKNLELNEIISDLVQAFTKYNGIQKRYATIVNDEGNNINKDGELTFSVLIPFRTEAFCQRIKQLFDNRTLKSKKDIIDVENFDIDQFDENALEKLVKAC